jgi:hypothetical protein
MIDAPWRWASGPMCDVTKRSNSCSDARMMDSMTARQNGLTR